MLFLSIQKTPLYNQDQLIIHKKFLIGLNCISKKLYFFIITNYNENNYK